MLKTVDLNPAEDQTHCDICLGMMALLGATSAFGQLPLTRAVGALHGALKSGNFRIYLGSNNRPSAALVWAYLSDEATEDYLNKGYLADLKAWNSGDSLWFLPVIAEGGKIKDIIDDAINSPTFASYERGHMLRVGPTGRRRIVSFTRKGVELVRTLPK